MKVKLLFLDFCSSTKKFRENGCVDLTLLKCTSTYPATPENTNLLTIPHLKQLFNCRVGLSEHTLGLGVSVASVSLGASVIEKHFTLNRADGGVDSAFSIEPHELKSLIVESERAFQALGDIKYGIQDVEKKSLIYKRSIYVCKNISKGEKFSSENLRVVRPGLGLSSRFYQDIIGKVALLDIKSGTPLTWEIL